MPGWLIEGEGKTPTIEDVTVAWNQVRFRTQFLSPQILEVIKERERKEKEEQRKLKNDSELLQSGQPDILSQLHQSSGSRYGRGLLQKTIAAEVRHEHPKKNGWGPYKNMKRSEYGEHVNKILRRKEIDDINQALTDAEPGGNW